MEQLRLQLQQVHTELERSRTVIEAMASSKFWQLRKAWFWLRYVLGLTNKTELNYPDSVLSASLSPQGFLVELSKITPEIPQATTTQYQKWLNHHYPRQADLQRMAEAVKLFPYQPLISLIVPVFNTSAPFLRQTIASVLHQVYPYWEICFVEDGSAEASIQEVVESYASNHANIKLMLRQEHGGMCDAINVAIEHATGEFIALLDPDSLLTPDALYASIVLLNQQMDADMIYSDEDEINQHNQLHTPCFKPDWCPDSLLSRMYTGNLAIYRRSLVHQVGGFRPAYESSLAYDLVLRLTEKSDRVFHLPQVLYHRRIPTAIATNPACSEMESAQRAILDALKRRGELGTVIPGEQGTHIVRYQIRELKPVSVIIPTRDLGNFLNRCLESIFAQTTYPNYEVLVIDNGSVEPETHKILAQWKASQPDRFHCAVLDIPFNYSKINNYAVSKARGDYLLFLNNDTEVLTPDWMSAMVEQAQRPNIGAVGALLLYPDGTIQHAGVIVGLGYAAGHSHQHAPANSSGYFNQVQTVNNYSAVTAACLMCRRQVFDAVGGFNEELSVAFNDVDFCLKILQKGYRNVYLPHVKLYHYESKSRGLDKTLEQQLRFAKETQYIHSQWQDIVAHDPCYNPHLTRRYEDYRMRLED